MSSTLKKTSSKKASKKAPKKPKADGPKSAEEPKAPKKEKPLSEIEEKIRARYNLDDPVEAELAQVEREIFGMLPQEIIDNIDRERDAAREQFEGKKVLIPTQIKRAVDQLKKFQANYNKCKHANPQDPDDAAALRNKQEYEKLIEKQHLLLQNLLVKWQRIKRGIMG